MIAATCRASASSPLGCIIRQRQDYRRQGLGKCLRLTRRGSLVKRPRIPTPGSAPAAGSTGLREDTKLAKIREAMRDDDWDTALRLASRFQRLGDHATAIRRAADMTVRPEFYRQLGYDVEAVKAAGIAAIKERFNLSWREASTGPADGD
jgi:hypothetical protein